MGGADSAEVALNGRVMNSVLHGGLEEARTHHSCPWPPSQSSKMVLASVRHGGAGGTRTPDPLNAIEVLSQLSYSPTVSMSKIAAGWQSPGAERAGPAVRTNRL